MNRMGIRALRTMKLRMEAHRYMSDLFLEFERRGIDEEDSYWIWEAYENATQFLYELKHNPRTYDVPVKERTDHIMVVVAISLQVDARWRRSRDFPFKYKRRDLLKKIIEQIRAGEIEDMYISEVTNLFPDRIPEHLIDIRSVRKL